MGTLLETWEPYLNEHALLLLQNAKNVADTQKIDVNILHILFMALTNINLNIYQRVKEEIKSKWQLEVDELVKDERFRELVDKVQDKMKSDVPSLSLGACRLACVEIAREQKTQISDTLILGQILEKSYTVKQILQRYNALQVLRSASQIPTLLHTTVLNHVRIDKLLGKVEEVSLKQEDLDAFSLVRTHEAAYKSPSERSSRASEPLCGREGRLPHLHMALLVWRWMSPTYLSHDGTL